MRDRDLARRRLRAQCGDDPSTADQHSKRVADAASAAIHAGAAVSAIAEAERMGEERARTELRTDILRRVADTHAAEVPPAADQHRDDAGEERASAPLAA